MFRQAEDDGNDDPADGIVNDRVGYDDLAKIATHEVHLADHHGDDLYRRDGERGAEKQRGDDPQFWARQHRVRQELAQHKPAYERNNNAGARNTERSVTDPPYQT